MCINAISEVELCQKKYIKSYQKYMVSKLMDYFGREIGVYEFFCRKQMFIEFYLIFYIKVMKVVVIKNFVIAKKKGKW